MNSSCRLMANAKINLCLNVKNRRPDGYHNIQSVMQSITLYDIVELTLKSKPGINTEFLNADIGHENSAFCAAEMFYKKTDVQGGVDIKITKQIPICSGMGGGSSDAAAVLYGLNALYGCPLSKTWLLSIGASIGADVPFCLTGGTAAVTGLGEVVQPLPPLKSLTTVIIKHHKKESTAQMYKKLDDVLHEGNKVSCDDRNTFNVITESLLLKDRKQAFLKCSNDFLHVSDCFEKQKEIIDMLYKNGAELSGLSGSGPAIFGIFKEAPPKEFLDLLKVRFESVFVCKTAENGIIQI